MLRKNNWVESLLKIYKDENQAIEIADRMEQKFQQYEGIQKESSWVTEKDSILITYGDSLLKEGEASLATLQKFLRKHVGNVISTIHILPMFPSTSDDGFSVVDYKQIDKNLGDWTDISELSKDYDLMFDAVVNHVSKSSEWFQKYLACEEPYSNYFITCDPNADYSSVTRPRALPLLTEFVTKEGKKSVWTTFSDDQIDLNFKCPDVLIDMLDVLLTYAKNGARYIRLDAIGFMWKKLGTTCMHLPETHEIIKLARKVLEDYVPRTLLITETNVQHKDNISYFGNGHDEAHLIYQFPLPPLILYSFLSGNAKHLIEWAASLETPEKGSTYFNFLSSHDGIGVRPTEGILSTKEQQFLVDSTLKNGGVVSFKDNGDGTKSPYELNINYQDALASPEDSDDIRIKRFIAAETILLSLQGVPGIYIHSLLGSRNDYYGKSTSGIPRRINREKLKVIELEKMLSEDGNRKQIFEELRRRLKIRGEHSAFAPDSEQTILKLDERIFALIRRNSKNGEKITILINVSQDKVTINNVSIIGTDILFDRKLTKTFEMQPLDTAWIIS